MARSLAVFALVFAACVGSAGCSTGSGKPEATESASSSGASSMASSSRESSTSYSSVNLCPHLATCCGRRFLGDNATAPPSCAQIADAGVATSCELALLAMQDEVDQFHLVGYACGIDYSEGNPIPPDSNPACEALASCCPTMPDTNDSITCGFVQGLHFSRPCDYALAYYKSVGDCSAVAFDAGTWKGLAPVDTNATTGNNTGAGTTSASFSSSH